MGPVPNGPVEVEILAVTGESRLLLALGEVETAVPMGAVFKGADVKPVVPMLVELADTDTVRLTAAGADVG